MPNINYYRILNLPNNCTQTQIEKSYRQLVASPNGNTQILELNAESMLELERAYSILSDQRKRSRYDVLLLKSEITGAVCTSEKIMKILEADILQAEQDAEEIVPRALGVFGDSDSRATGRNSEKETRVISVSELRREQTVLGRFRRAVGL